MTQPALPPIGTFFMTSWGYDQTNVECYKVVGHTPSGKSIRLQRWTTKDVGGAGESAHRLVPGDEVAKSNVYGEPWTDADGYSHRGDLIGLQDAPTFVHRAQIHGRTKGSDADGWTTMIGGHYAGSHREGETHYATAAGWGH